MAINQHFKFTELEEKIIDQLKFGYTNSVIAKKLNFSPYTIKYHIARIISKTGAVNRINALYILAKHGYFNTLEQEESQV